jgi:hypothetical protein
LAEGVPFPRSLFTPAAAGERDLPWVGVAPCGCEAARPLWRSLSKLHKDPEQRRPRGTDSDQPMTTSSGPLSPERRLALLRDIRDGRYALQAGPSPEAQAVLAAKLAEWRELVKLEDIRMRTIYESTAPGEEARVALAALTLSGLRFPEEHQGESGDPTEEG